MLHGIQESMSTFWCWRRTVWVTKIADIGYKDFRAIPSREASHTRQRAEALPLIQRSYSSSVSKLMLLERRGYYIIIEFDRAVRNLEGKQAVKWLCPSQGLRLEMNGRDFDGMTAP